MQNSIERFFKLKESNTNIQTELIAGLTTFLTMAYIIFVNPLVLQIAGLPVKDTMAATCIVAAITSILMGVFANYPFALAPGMGLNAFLTYSICKNMGLPWEVGMAIVFIEGLIITILVLTKFRKLVMDCIPISLKHAIGIGIGLFIAFIGLKECGFVQSNPATLVSLGDFSSTSTILASVGLIIIIALVSLRVRGAILLGIVITTLICILFNIAPIPDSILAVPSFSTFGKFVFGFREAMKLSMLLTIFAFLLSDFFDTMGTVIAVGNEAGFLKKGELPRLNRVLLVDSLGALLGGVFSSSSATTYIESASGVAAGGRTGLTSVVVGFLFIFSLFFSPIVGIVPIIAVAPALIIVGFLMVAGLKEIHWENLEESFPSFRDQPP